MTRRARTVFLGTGSFGVPVAAALAEHPAVELTAVVTAPQRPGQRRRPSDPPVAAWAAQRGLHTLRPERLRAPDAADQLRALAPDLLVLADYGQIVPATVLDLPEHGALNLHPSLLPRHRGATPIPATILAGDAETGVTLIKMDAGLDTGPVIAQWRFSLSGHETAPELEEALADLGARLLEATLAPWLAGKIEPQPQDGSAATLTRVLKRSDGRLDAALPAATLERQVRAYQPWPGSFLETGAGRLIVWRATVGASRQAQQPGVLTRGDEAALALVAADALLELHDVQPAGGRRMTSAELVRGHGDWIGTAIELPRADTGR